MTSQKSKGSITLILVVIVALVALYFGLKHKEDIGDFFDKVKSTFTKVSTVLHTGRPSHAKALETLKSFLNTLPKGDEEEIKKYLTEEALQDRSWFEPWTIIDTEIGRISPLGPQDIEIETTITSKAKTGSSIHLDLNFHLIQEKDQWKIAGKAERK